MVQGVGETLREARERRGIDLAEVEATTRIRARFLRALENEEWDVLPGEAYTRGFIRTYAGYLGLDGALLSEQHRRDTGAERPGEGLLGVDPTPRPVRDSKRGSWPAPRAFALLVPAALVAVLVLALSSGGGGPSETPERRPDQGGGQRAAGAAPPSPSPQRPGLSLRLTATAEVWVCLLDGRGEPLVDGQILAPGAEAGPFRSGSFTVSFGNGEVSMTVNGQQASIPATSSPIGYSIGAGSAMRELPEGERPTCT
jgi:cytoskeleton protein RodZ